MPRFFDAFCLDIIVDHKIPIWYFYNKKNYPSPIPIRQIQSFFTLLSTHQHINDMGKL